MLNLVPAINWVISSLHTVYWENKCVLKKMQIKGKFYLIVESLYLSEVDLIIQQLLLCVMKTFNKVKCIHG